MGRKDCATKKSKLTITAFCQRENIAVATFHWWKRKLGGVDTKKGASGFVEIMPKEAPGEKAQALVLHIQGCYRIEIPEGISPEYIAGILKALR